MEVTGNLLLIQRIYNTGLAYVNTLVTDDDTTTRAALHHSWSDKIKAKLMQQSEWPRDKNNRKKKIADAYL
jgi:hypothetical protein